MYPCPRSRLRIWSRETGSAVPPRVSLLILHTQAASGSYSRDFRDSAHIDYTVNRHRVSPKLIGSSRSFVSMAFTAECPLVQGQWSSMQFQERVLPFQVSP